MFYSHQLLARKAPLGQIWMAATMHAKINRRKLDKLNIIKICEEILNPKIPMALRLSGILMGGVVIVYERKVKLLYDDVTRLMVEINEAWKVKSVPDPTVLPKGKSKAKKEAITLPEMNEGDIEQSLQFSNTANTMGFHHGAYFTMRLDNVDEPYFKDGSREEEDLSVLNHQADLENITLPERYEPFSVNADSYNRFERFDIEGDEETQVNTTSGAYTHFPTMLRPSPPHQQEPTGTDIFQGQPQPENAVIQQSDEGMIARQEHGRRGPTKRKRELPAEPAMDYEQTMVPAHIYQHWLQNPSHLVSRRGSKKKLLQKTNMMSSTKIGDLMKLPPIALIGDLFTSGNRDVYYPAPILDLWNKSNQVPHDSPSERTSATHPPEPSFSSPPGVPDEDFTRIPLERMRVTQNNDQDTTILMDDDHGLRDHEANPIVTSRKSGDSTCSLPRTESEHGPASGRTINGSKKRRHSLSGNSSGGLEPVFEDVINFKLAHLSELSPTPDQELIVETGPTQTQVKINHPNDKMTDSIHAQMKAHFNTPGAPQVESLDILAAGMTRKSAAQLFYQTCVLASRDALRVEQKVCYGEILISRGSKM